MPSNHLRFEHSETPLLHTREAAHIEFLEHAAATDDPIFWEHKNALDFPSYRIAKELTDLGLLVSRKIESDEPTQGRDPSGYFITDAGRQLLPKLQSFVGGAVVHVDADLLEYWRVAFPARVTQHLVNKALTGSMDALLQLQAMGDDPIASAMALVLPALISAPLGSTVLQANVHSQDEVKGGQLFSRFNGWTRAAIDEIKDTANIDGDTELFDYMVAVTYAVTLYAQNYGVPESIGGVQS